ncbi:helix-turn-helix domain-containing protein [Mycobacterium manitobense]|uniref:Helix-turn-helix domain-containing protein n=1 Tax=[Mycobacterium] manitobense TaxID=190147 RepID=A0A9X2YSD0_9MYCO|nr:helix-turn-helix domain-containing protein [[Mycobacterium] manitobense]MCV7172660.1 helix-turn-helix domain-containing protein [[Mycobacterium] manitobense]
MSSTMYSPDDVAAMLGLHVRTVRGYVRDGRLPAVRIGKQYRITAKDLREFTGGAGGDDRPAPSAPRVDVSAVIHVDAADRRLMDRISTHVVAAANTGPGRRPLHVQTSYDEPRERLTVIVAGDPDDAAKLITLISALAQDVGR